MLKVQHDTMYMCSAEIHEISLSLSLSPKSGSQAQEPSGNWPTHTWWAIRSDCVGNWRGVVRGSVAQHGWLCLNSRWLIGASLQPSCARRVSRKGKQTTTKKNWFPRNKELYTSRLDTLARNPLGPKFSPDRRAGMTLLRSHSWKYIWRLDSVMENEQAGQSKAPCCVRNNTVALTVFTSTSYCS